MKKYTCILTGILCLAFTTAHGNLELNNLEISNRAQCAVSANHATKSAFLILDGYNAGRLTHGLGRSIYTEDIETFTSKGMTEFRLAVAGLQEIILSKLANGDLPLLPANLEKTNLDNYARIAKSCQSEVYCPDLSNYLERLWRISEQPFEERAQHYTQLDSNLAHKFLNAGEVRNRCYYLKKFSPLQSHLYGTDIRKNGLTQLAQALLENNRYVTDCQDRSSDLESRNVALQIEVFTENKNWNTLGFDYWNSLKIYLSWAWRNADHLKTFAPTFHAPFRSVDLEESLLFISNGCKSLTEPKCDATNLSLNSLRELAKVQVQSDEFDKYIAAGPADELLKKGARAVNSDFLSLSDYDKASEWVGNFRNNFKDRQLLFRNKLLLAHQFFSILSTTVSPSDIINSLDQLSSIAEQNSALKNEFYYLCTEWNLSSNPEFDFLHTDILDVASINEMVKQSTTIGRDINGQIQYYKDVSTALGTFCENLEDKDFFNYTEDNLPTPDGYKPWAQEMLSPILEENTAPTTTVAPVTLDTPFLVTGSNGITLCQTAVDCARNVIKHTIDLLNVSKFSEAFLSEGSLRSSEMLNPYNELAACKVYDPWFTKKRVRKRFVGDLINTAISGATGIPLYLDVDFTPNRVTSLNKMIEDGEVRFAPDIQKGRMAFSVLADLGPLAGAPCAVQISPNADKAFNFYAFSGISLNACHVNSTRQIDYASAKDAHINRPTDRSFCAGCTLNFVGVASSISYTTADTSFNPLKVGVYLFRAVYRFFKGMKDPVNIPRTVSLDLNLLKNTYERLGGIPNTCVKDIKQGKECKIRYCDAKATLWLEEESTEEVSKLNIKKGREYSTVIHRDKCGYEYELKFKCDEKNKTSEFISLDKTKKFKNRCKSKSNLAATK